MAKEEIITQVRTYVKTVKKLALKRDDPKGMARQAENIRKITSKLRKDLEKERLKSPYKDILLIDKNLRFIIKDLIHFEAENKKRFITDEDLSGINSTIRESLAYIMQDIRDMRAEFYPLGDGYELARTYFPDEFIRKHSNMLALVARSAGRSAGIAYLRLRALNQHLEESGYKIESHTKALVEIAEAAKEDTSRAYDALTSLPATIVDKYMPILVKIAQVTRKGYVKSAFRNLPIELMDRYHKIVLLIAEKSRERTGAVFNNLPKVLFVGKSPREAYKQISRLLRKYGPATASVLRDYGVAFDKEYSLLIGKNKRFFGIKNIHRYVKKNWRDGKLDISLLTENLNNLDANHNAGKPIAVAVYCIWDWIDNFSGSTHEYLKELSKGYKLFIFEADTNKSFLEAIKKAYYFSKKRFSLLIIGGHGTQNGIVLGHSGNDSKLSTGDKPIFQQVSQYMDRRSTIVLHACSTGEGGEKEYNLATVMHQFIPQSHLFAAKSVSGGIDWKFYDNGIFKDVKLRARKGTLHLKAA